MNDQLSRADEPERPVLLGDVFHPGSMLGAAAGVKSTVAAYDWLCSDAKAELDLAAYQEQLRQEEAVNGRMRSFNVSGSQVEFGGDAVVVFDVTSTVGHWARNARLVKEDGEWRWCGAGPRTERGRGL